VRDCAGAADAHWRNATDDGLDTDSRNKLARGQSGVRSSVALLVHRATRDYPENASNKSAVAVGGCHRRRRSSPGQAGVPLVAGPAVQPQGRLCICTNDLAMGPLL